MSLWNTDDLNCDCMHHFHMKMSLFGLCTLFSKVTLFSLYQKGSVRGICGPQICQKMRCRPGLRSRPRWGISRRSPRFLSRLWRGHPLPFPPPSAPRFSLHLRRSASGNLCPPNVKSWLRPCSDGWVANLPNRYSALCWRPVTHAQTWASYSALYRFGRLSGWVFLGRSP